jgi:hypothetical protein
MSEVGMLIQTSLWEKPVLPADITVEVGDMNKQNYGKEL